MMCSLETLQRGNTTPPAPFGPWAACRSPDESISLATAQRPSRSSTPRAFVAEPTEDDRERQCYPRGQRDREHHKGNDKNGVVHRLVVVARFTTALPRTRDPAADLPAAPGKTTDSRRGRLAAVRASTDAILATTTDRVSHF
jgi:hypothetical protein